MAHATVGAVELFYTDDGHGDPMLFVHRTACDSHDWSRQLAHFVQHHRIVAIDLRGRGRPSAPPDWLRRSAPGNRARRVERSARAADLSWPSDTRSAASS